MKVLFFVFVLSSIFSGCAGNNPVFPGTYTVISGGVTQVYTR